MGRKIFLTLLPILLAVMAFGQTNATFNNLDVRTNARVRNNLTLDGNAYLVTTSATDGIIYQNGSRLLHNKGTFNTFLGTNAGNLTNTGNGNVGIGLVALLALTNGEGNNAIGLSALSSTTTGDWNVSFGYSSLLYNTTGSKNIGIGYNSLYSNVANSGSIAIGYEAMIYADDRAVGQSTYNIAIGNYALSGSATAANNTGTENIAIGEQAIINNTTGTANIGIGRAASNHSTTGNNNIYIGSFSGWNNETGSENTAVGKSSMSGVFTKSQTGNTAFGYNSLFSIGDNGNYNVAVGHGAGYSNVTGDNNVFLGYQAGYNETGSNKLYIENTNADSTGALIFGNFGTNTLRFNADITYGQTHWEDLTTSATQAKVNPATSKPAYVSDSLALKWDDADTTTNFTDHSFQFKHAYAPGTNIYPHVHYWQHSAADTCEWMILLYRWTDIGEPRKTYTRVHTNNQTAFAYTSGSLHQIAAFPAIVDGGAHTESSIFDCKLYVWADGELYTSQLDIHFEQNKPGTFNEYP